MSLFQILKRKRKCLLDSKNHITVHLGKMRDFISLIELAVYLVHFLEANFHRMYVDKDILS